MSTPTQPDNPGPPDDLDPVIEAWKKHVDGTLIRRNLALSVQERIDQLQRLAEFSEDLDHLIHLKRAAGRPRDLDAIAELEAIREEKRHNSGTAGTSA